MPKQAKNKLFTFELNEIDAYFRKKYQLKSVIDSEFDFYEEHKKLIRLKAELSSIAKKSDWQRELYSEIMHVKNLPLSTRFYIVKSTFFCSPILVPQMVISAVIIKAIGFSGLASLGAIAGATAIGSLLVMPLAALWGWFGPKNTMYHYDLKTALLHSLVCFGLGVLGVTLGSLILGINLSPTLFIGLAVVAGIGTFFTMIAAMTAKQHCDAIQNSTYKDEYKGAITQYVEELKKRIDAEIVTCENDVEEKQAIKTSMVPLLSMFISQSAIEKARLVHVTIGPLDYQVIPHRS